VCENMIGTGDLVTKSKEKPLNYYAAELQGSATFFYPKARRND